MHFFIIVHKPTGHIFPQRLGIVSQTRVSFSSPTDEAPRLWSRKGDAKRWLTTYCKGVHYINGYTNHEGEYDSSMEIDPKTVRNRDEYDIIRVAITNA